MPALPAVEVLAGLAFLFASAVPLGVVLLRALEKLVGHRWALTPLERVLVAFYATGGLLFVIASAPIPIFFPDVIVAILAGGGLAYALVSIRERGRGLREFSRWLQTGPALALAAGTVGCLILYVSTIGSLTAANGLDGAIHSLFVTLLLRNHTVPTTLLPFEPAGVEYPQGAPVWQALPVILFGWPVIASPVVLPALFLGLTPAAAYCWGERSGGVGRARGARRGLLFAGFFGLVASWPRLFVGGSFDFAFALPLFLLTMGWFPILAERPRRAWGQAVALGLLVGVSASLSATIGLELVVLLGAAWLLYAGAHRQEFAGLAARFTVVLALGGAFLARSFLGFIEWFSYPGQVLSVVGTPPTVPPGGLPLPPYRFVTGELDPFVLWKYKLSPIPYLSLELALLLAFGLLVLAAWFRHPTGRIGRHLSASLVRSVTLGTVATFGMVAFLLVVNFVGGPLAPIESITSVDEFSFLLFIWYGSIALIPLVVAVGYLEDRWTIPHGSSSPRAHHIHRISVARSGVASRPVAIPWATLLAVVIIAQPLAVGAAATATVVPAYLSAHVEAFANVSDADIAALQWSGSHLPRCSRVLVAPGSAARYLPEFAHVQIISVEGYAWNFSYASAIRDLSAGVFDSATRADLVQLGVTEVFVTGPTSIEFAPFVPGPLENSSNFVSLYHSGDAYIFGFVPGLQGTDCPS